MKWLNHTLISGAICAVGSLLMLLFVSQVQLSPLGLNTYLRLVIDISNTEVPHMSLRIGYWLS